MEWLNFSWGNDAAKDALNSYGKQLETKRDLWALRGFIDENKDKEACSNEACEPIPDLKKFRYQISRDNQELIAPKLLCDDKSIIWSTRTSQRSQEALLPPPFSNSVDIIFSWKNWEKILSVPILGGESPLSDRFQKDYYKKLNEWLDEMCKVS